MHSLRRLVNFAVDPAAVAGSPIVVSVVAFAASIQESTDCRSQGLATRSAARAGDSCAGDEQVDKTGGHVKHPYSVPSTQGHNQDPEI